MLENLFRGLFDTDLVTVISVTDFLLCLGFSLVLGLVMAFAYMYEVKWTRDRKSITYSTPDGKRCRDNKLHEEKFLKENMEYEFRIRNEIARGIKRYGESAYEESGDRRPLYSGDGRELEGTDRRDEYADRYALSDTDIADGADYERGTYLV